TDRTDAGAVCVVNGFLVFRVDVVTHLVTGNAELLGVGHLHGRVETAPEDDPADEANQQQYAQRVANARLLEFAPQAVFAFEKFHGDVLNHPTHRAWDGLSGASGLVSTRRAWC